MDTRNSAMVAGLYLAGIVIVVVVCLGYYTYERNEVGPSSVVLDLKEGANLAPRTAPHTGHLEPANYYRASLVKANQTLRDLQTSLAGSRDRLERQSQTINQKNAECQALKDELDQTFALLLNLLADESSDDAASRESTKQAKGKVESELEQLIDSLKQSEVLGTEQKEQLAQLRADLKRTDMQLATVQEQSELEIAALLTEKKTLETVATEVIAHSGTAAIPLLVDRLADERHDVRRWAVKALGAFGPDAMDALPAMRRLLTDPEPLVREEAQRAVAAVSETE